MNYRFYGTTDDMLECVNYRAEVVNNQRALIRMVSTTCTYIVCVQEFSYTCTCAQLSLFMKKIFVIVTLIIIIIMELVFYIYSY